MGGTEDPAPRSYQVCLQAQESLDVFGAGGLGQAQGVGGAAFPGEQSAGRNKY